MVEHKGSTSLFAIFALSLYSLFIIPYTIYHFCSASEETVVQPYLQVRRRSAVAATAMEARFIDCVQTLSW